MRKIITAGVLLWALCCPALAAGQEKYLALTFDDGPSGRFTQTLLEGLAARNVHATFFLCGYRLETYGPLAGQIRAGGHEIGLHGYSHAPMADMSRTKLEQELSRTRALLPRATLVNLLRAPGGQLNDTIRACGKQDNLALIQWSVDPKDWATEDTERIYQSILAQVDDGGVILLHDMSDSSVQAALRAVDTLKARGYHFLTVSQLAMLRLTHLTGGESYRCFPPAGA